jgi:hypothetical protein
MELLAASFEALCEGRAAAMANPPPEVRVAAGTDACEVRRQYVAAAARRQSIYLPPRTPAEGRVNPDWPADFARAFRLANDDPYPKWFGPGG